MENKRKPMLADWFVNKRYTDANSLGVTLAMIPTVQDMVRKATKFVFSDEATKHVGNVIRDMPELIVRESSLVRAPYELTYFEFNRAKLWRQIYTHDPERLAGEQGDHSAMNGVLISGNTVMIITGGTVKTSDLTKEDFAARSKNLSDVWITPFMYWLHENMRAFHERGISDLITDIHALYWGSTCNDIPIDELKDLSNNFAVMPICKLSRYKHLAQITPEFYGDLRNVIAFLLMMNRPSVTSFSNATPKHRGWIGNKVASYASHSTVTITLDPRPTMKMLGTLAGSGVKLRRHEVRGHYAHDQITRDYGAIGCLHDWQTTNRYWQAIELDNAELPMHGVCKVCNGKRWFVREHERGDESLGRVIHDGYDVKR